MDNTKSQVVARYTEAQKAMIQEMCNKEQFFTFLYNDLAEGLSRTAGVGNPLDSNGWMHDLVVEHIGIPRQNGEAPNRDEFARKAEALYEGLRVIRESFKSYEIVAEHMNKDDSDAPVKTGNKNRK